MKITRFLKPITRFIKSQRMVSRGDYEGASQILEDELTGTKEDLPYLEAIAHYHCWGENEEKAIGTAKKALTIDPNNFEMSRILSVIYAKHKNHEEAAKYVKIAIQNYKPKDGSAFPRWLPNILRVASRFSTRLKNAEETVKEDFRDPNKGMREWRAWADEYLSWYNETMSN